MSDSDNSNIFAIFRYAFDFFFFFCWSLQTFLPFSILCDFSFKVGRALVKKKFLKKTLSNRIVRGDRGEYSAVP